MPPTDSKKFHIEKKIKIMLREFQEVNNSLFRRYDNEKLNISKTHHV